MNWNLLPWSRENQEPLPLHASGLTFIPPAAAVMPRGIKSSSAAIAAAARVPVIPTVVAEVDPCAICLEDLADPANALPTAVLDRCPHRFHAPCIAAWAGVTNLCPLCKTRFKTLTELPSPNNSAPTAAAAAAAGGGRALRSKAGKVIRVATKNQNVESSSSSEEEPVAAPPARGARSTRRRQANGEETELHLASSRPARRVTATPVVRRSARGSARSVRSRRAEKSEASEEDEDNVPAELETEGEHSAAHASTVAARSSRLQKSQREMSEEDLLTWAVKESIRISEPAPAAAAAAAAVAASVRPVTSSRRPPRQAAVEPEELPRRRGRRHIALPASDEEEHKEDGLPLDAENELHSNDFLNAPLVLEGEAFEHAVPQALEEEHHESKSRRNKTTRSRKGGRTKTGKKSRSMSDEDAEVEDQSSQPKEGQIGWMRTRDGKWARTRATALTADALLAQHKVQLQQAMYSQPAAAAIPSLPQRVSLQAAASSSVAPIPSSLASSRVVASSALAQASSALDSFEQRILQRKQAQRDAEEAAERARRQAEAAAEAAAIAGISSPPRRRVTRMSTTCDPAEAEAQCDSPLVGAPGGLRIFKRRRTSGAPPLSSLLNNDHTESHPRFQKSSAFAPDDERRDNDAGDISLSSVCTSDYGSSPEKQQQQHCRNGDHQHLAEVDEIARSDGGVVGSLWTRMSKFSSFLFTSKLCPSTPSPYKSVHHQAPGGPKMQHSAEKLHLQQQQKPRVVFGELSDN